MPWFILDRNGQPQDPATLPARPPDAQPDEGDAFTPWYKQDEHLHVAERRIDGIHARGGRLEDVAAKLQGYLAHEQRLLEVFGGHEDILLPEVDAFLRPS